MDVGKLSSEEKAEIMRRKARYRELILSGRLVLPQSRAALLLGPDCLYHLYSIKTKDNRRSGRRYRSLRGRKMA